MSVLITSFFTIFIPYLMDLKINSVDKCVKLICCSVLCIIFWGKFLQQPLSDMPAMVFMACFLYCLKKIVVSDKINIAIIYGLLGGFSCYAAYNTRTVYSTGCIISIIWFVWFSYKNKKILQIVKTIPFILVGFFIAAFPQMLLNQHWMGEFTPRVFVELYFDDNLNLKTQQVLWGISSARYETYVGNLVDYITNGVNFGDVVGMEIAYREQLDPNTFTYFTWIKLVFKYPLDFIGIYTRHLFSYLTFFYREPFIQNLFVPKGFLITISILIWIIGGVGVYSNVRLLDKKTIIKKVFYFSGALSGLLLPAMLIIFGAPEIRFFIAVHMIWYITICCFVDWKKTIQYIKERFISVIIVSISVFFVWSTIVGNILSYNDYTGRTMIIEDASRTHGVIQSLVQEDEIILNSDVKNQSKYTGIDVNLKPNSCYRISFDVDDESDIPENLEFVMSSNEETSSWEMRYPFEISKTEKHYEYIVSSGESAGNASLDVIYSTRDTAVLKNFSIDEVYIIR